MAQLPGTVFSVGRPRVYGETRVTTAIRVPQKLHQRLHKAAGERDVSVNFLVVRAVEDYLSRLVPTSDVKLSRDPDSFA
jgi:hypothetical protein